MKADKSYLLGADRLTRLYIGEMQTLGFERDEIVEAVIEQCLPDSLETFIELNQQLKHIKEIIDA